MKYYTLSMFFLVNKIKLSIFDSQKKTEKIKQNPLIPKL